MGNYGKYASDGSVEVEATECILTGRALAAPYDNTVRERVSGTPYFYRVLGSQYHRVTDELREAWQADSPKQTAPAFMPKSKAMPAIEVKE
jgi:hypothetical protein